MKTRFCSALPRHRYARRWMGALLALFVTTFSLLNAAPAYAGAIDPYVARFLDVAEPVALPFDSSQSKLFSGAEISVGKRLFEDNCKTCHVGGATLPDPLVPLSLEALKAATPPRDTINSLVAYIRHPMTYDGSEEAFSCREVPESWMSSTEVENLAAFIIRAAQKAPRWGSTLF
ncbi:MAG TPA: photosystem II cytochrome PsbV2 [Chroococcidiopsis sp.]